MGMVHKCNYISQGFSPCYIPWFFPYSVPERKLGFFVQALNPKPANETKGGQILLDKNVQLMNIGLDSEIKFAEFPLSVGKDDFLSPFCLKE